MRKMLFLSILKPVLSEHMLNVSKVILTVDIFVVASVQSLVFVQNNIQWLYHTDNSVCFGCVKFLQTSADSSRGGFAACFRANRSTHLSSCISTCDLTVPEQAYHTLLRASVYHMVERTLDLGVRPIQQASNSGRDTS
jgi:hypothetical protein